MKMMYRGVPIKSLNIKHFEVSTNDATLRASDLQSGITAYAKGKKVTGTGKAFSFAMYGDFSSNRVIPIPVSEINTVIISAVDYDVKMIHSMRDIRTLDFSTNQEIATISINDMNYPIMISVADNRITFTCEQNVTIQVLFGKDDYT